MSLLAPLPASRLLFDPEWSKELWADLARNMLIPRILLTRRQKFRRPRLVHAQRARKLRRRGETVYFERWDHGHCIYSWSGPTPEVFRFRRMPLKRGTVVSAYTPVNYRGNAVLLLDDLCVEKSNAGK